MTKSKFLTFLILAALIIFFSPSTAYAQSQCLTGPSACPTVGSVCPDGTVYVGCAADLYVRLYVERCDGGQSWSGIACTGTRTAQYWANSSAATSSSTTTGVTSKTDGQANTIALTNGVENGTGDSRTTAGVQAHNAAKFCADLVEHGYDDWYLPSLSELNTISVNRTAGALAGTFSANEYWSSTEYYSTTVFAMPLSDVTAANETGAIAKNVTANIRCMRHN